MQSTENGRGARHRLLILMYITLLSLSLAPAEETPPERRFAQGQPEMQQAMYNMVNDEAIIKKRMPTPASDNTNNQAEVTSKTSSLLAEAEQVLHNLPDSKERQWIESFVQRMRAISTMLEKTAHNKNLPKSLNSASDTPVPEGLSSQPTWPATSAVPGINPFQKTNRMMSKFPVTSPELSKVLPANEYTSERQVVTKPAVLSNKKEETESDELVRELESLHQEHAQPDAQQNSKVLDQVPSITTPTPLFSESENAKLADVEAEKARIKAKLIEEIAEFHHLGGVIPRDVIFALYEDNLRATALAYNQNINVVDKTKFTEAGLVDRQEIQSDLNSEEKGISNANLQNTPYQAGQQLQQMRFNQTFQNIHPNFHPNLQAFARHMGNNFYYMSHHNKDQPYRSGFQNRAQGLQNRNPYNPGNYHDISPPNQQLGQVPDALKQVLSKQQSNTYNGHLVTSNNVMKQGYGPYPYKPNWSPNNSTFNSASRISPYISKQQMNHQIDTQLSDEMKRELRDGKIIVLSDSVVRSNFDPNNNGKGAESTSVKPALEMMEKKKNETKMEN